ncbi:hypothetical protein QOT17_001969 [Balamuthia mandrillaris]
MSNNFVSAGFDKYGLEDTLSQMVGGRGQTATTRSTSSGPSGGGGLRTVHFQDNNAVQVALKEFANDSGNIDWVLLDYAAGSQDTLVLASKGSGRTPMPPTAVQHLLDDAKVQYLLVTQQQGGAAQYAFITWQGARAPAAQVQGSLPLLLCFSFSSSLPSLFHVLFKTYGSCFVLVLASAAHKKELHAHFAVCIFALSSLFGFYCV